MNTVQKKGLELKDKKKYIIEWMEFNGEQWQFKDKILHNPHDLNNYINNLFGHGLEDNNIILIRVSLSETNTPIGMNSFIGEFEEINENIEG